MICGLFRIPRAKSRIPIGTVTIPNIMAGNPKLVSKDAILIIVFPTVLVDPAHPVVTKKVALNILSPINPAGIIINRIPRRTSSRDDFVDVSTG